MNKNALSFVGFLMRYRLNKFLFSIFSQTNEQPLFVEWAIFDVHAIIYSFRELLRPDPACFIQLRETIKREISFRVPFVSVYFPRVFYGPALSRMKHLYFSWFWCHHSSYLIVLFPISNVLLQIPHH